MEEEKHQRNSFFDGPGAHPLFLLEEWFLPVVVVVVLSPFFFAAFWFSFSLSVPNSTPPACTFITLTQSPRSFVFLTSRLVFALGTERTHCAPCRTLQIFLLFPVPNAFVHTRSTQSLRFTSIQLIFPKKCAAVCARK